MLRLPIQSNGLNIETWHHKRQREESATGAADVSTSETGTEVSFQGQTCRVALNVPERGSGWYDGTISHFYVCLRKALR